MKIEKCLKELVDTVFTLQCFIHLSVRLFIRTFICSLFRRLHKITLRQIVHQQMLILMMSE